MVPQLSHLPRGRTFHTVLWRHLDREGLEGMQLSEHSDGWRMSGTALFLQDGVPSQIHYDLLCDEIWQFLRGGVHGWVGNRTIAHEITRGPAGDWSLDRIQLPLLEGCMDLDLQFTPSTNTIPLHRMALTIGERKESQAAWLRFPECHLERCRQAYTRLRADRYLYEKPDVPDFKAELMVDAHGVIREYPDLALAVEKA